LAAIKEIEGLGPEDYQGGSDKRIDEELIDFMRFEWDQKLLF